MSGVRGKLGWLLVWACQMEKLYKAMTMVKHEEEKDNGMMKIMIIWLNFIKRE